MTLLEEGALHAPGPAGEIRPGLRRGEGAGGGRRSGRSGATDHAGRSDEPHERPDLPFRRPIPGRQTCTARASFWTRNVRWKPPSTTSRAFRSPSSLAQRWRYSVGIDVVARVIEVDLRPSAGRLPARTPVRAAGHGRHGLRRPARETKPPGGDVRTPGRDRFRADHDERTRRLGEGRQRPPRRLEVLSGRFARRVRPRRPWPVRHDRRLFPLRPDAGERRTLDGARILGRKTAGAHARQSRAGGAPAPRHRRPALARLWFRPRLAGAHGRGPERRAGLDRRVRLGRARRRPITGSTRRRRSSASS